MKGVVFFGVFFSFFFCSLSVWSSGVSSWQLTPAAVDVAEAAATPQRKAADDTGGSALQGAEGSAPLLQRAGGL